jgi:hypothetical protein
LDHAAKGLAMKRSPSLSDVAAGVALALAAFFAGASQTNAKDPEPPDVTGFWETPEGEIRFYQGYDDFDPNRRDQYFYALLSGTAGSCPARGRRDWYVTGFIEGSRIEGTMMRCTETELVTKCRPPHQPTYKIPFTGTVNISESWISATVSKSMTLELRYNMEFFEIPEPYGTLPCKKLREELRNETITFKWQGLPKADDPSWQDRLKTFKDRGKRKALTLDPEPLLEE